MSPFEIPGPCGGYPAIQSTENGAVVRKFIDLSFGLRPMIVAGAVATGLLAGLCEASIAKAVKVATRPIPIPTSSLSPPSRWHADTHSAFVVPCNDHYVVRTYEVKCVFTPWAKLMVQFGQYQPIAADGEVKAPDQLRITLAPADQARFTSDLRAAQQLTVLLIERSALLGFHFDWRTDSEAAFGVTAVSYGIDVQQATAGFRTLTQEILRPGCRRPIPRSCAAELDANRMALWRETCRNWTSGRAHRGWPCGHHGRRRRPTGIRCRLGLRCSRWCRHRKAIATPTATVRYFSSSPGCAPIAPTKGAQDHGVPQIPGWR